jgi:hypothetical protein
MINLNPINRDIENIWFSSLKKNVKSQYGEDGILEKIFEIIPTSDKWCVEFGAWDGQFLSNTWNFINNFSWSAVLIECDKKRYQELFKYYKNNSKVFGINRFVNFDGPDNLDNILSETSVPLDFDLLSIDIDGNDYHIWASLQKYQPKVVIIEYNPTIPNDIRFVQERNFKVNQGVSLSALVELGKIKGYEFIACTTTNAIFVRDSFYPLFNITDNSINTLKRYDPELECRLYQLYDGTIIYEGNSTHCWTGYKIRKNKLQVLPKLLRNYWGHPNKPIFIRLLTRLHAILFK